MDLGENRSQTIKNKRIKILSILSVEFLLWNARAAGKEAVFAVFLKKSDGEEGIDPVFADKKTVWPHPDSFR